MKTFLTTLKGKLIAGIGTAVVVAAVVVGIILTNSGYRTIVVNAFNGVTKIVNGSKSSEAYKGLHLKAGDDVTVGSDADLTLAIDEDKYVYAEPTTHFWIEAKGKLDNTKTKVYMDKGSNLFRIDDKLEGDEFFEVDTPNSTMSVRGTVFRVTCYEDANGEFYTYVEVYEGEVFVQAKFEDGKNAEDNRVFKAGECVTIHMNPEVSEFVKSENGFEITPDDYRKIPQTTAVVMGEWIDNGRKLSVGKELLFDYVELKEHKWVMSVEEEATADKEGYSIEVCEICGLESGKKESLPKLEETEDVGEEEAEAADTDALVEETEEITDTEETNPEECEHTYGAAVVTKEPTYYEEGISEATCTKCGTKKTSSIQKKDMSYEMMEQLAQEIYEREIANCDHSYVLERSNSETRVYRCTKCGSSYNKEKEKVVCHHVWRQDPTGGVCVLCGARM